MCIANGAAHMLSLPAGGAWGQSCVGAVLCGSCRWSLGGSLGSLSPVPLSCTPGPLQSHHQGSAQGVSGRWEDLRGTRRVWAGREEEAELRQLLASFPGQGSDPRSALQISCSLANAKAPVGRKGFVASAAGWGQHFSGQESPRVSCLDQMWP